MVHRSLWYKMLNSVCVWMWGFLMSVFVADVAVDTGKLAVGPPYAVDNQAESGHPSEPPPGRCLPVEEVDQEKHTHADIYYNHEYT